MINTTQGAKTDLHPDQLLKLLELAGKYITATKNQITNATSYYNRLERECNFYDINMIFLLSQAKDYFKRKPNSKFLKI